MKKTILISTLPLCSLSLAAGHSDAQGEEQHQNNLSKKPNILFIVSDDLNTRIGPYMDIDNHTPHLNRLAEEGVMFSRAYCQYPLCGPSRASFMSGLYPETNGVLRNTSRLGNYRAETPELADHPSMAGFLREWGYYTARVSKIYHMGVPGGIERGDPGPDDPDSWDYVYNVLAPETMSQGELELLSPKNTHYGGNFSKMIIPDELDFTQADYLAASQAIAILENRAGKVPEDGTNLQRLKRDDPFFLAVGFVRPHVPFIAPESCFEPYPLDEVQLPPVIIGDNVPDEALARQNDRIWGMDQIQKRKAIRGYMASVRFMDRQVGRLLDALERLGIRDETIVIFLSDHGYNLGEHDCWSKRSLWEGSVRAPLIISVPGSEFEHNHGTKCESIVEFIDLYPTVAELTGLGHEAPEILQGKSLVDYIKDSNKNDPDSYAYSITNRGQAGFLRTDRWRYSRWGDEVEPGNEELYDHDNDPEEYVNLADDPEMLNVLKELRIKYGMARDRARNGLKAH